MTFGSYFHGFGIADEGARLAGLRPKWGVELDADLAGVAVRNGHAVVVSDVRTVERGTLGYVDWYHTSPPCPEFSSAKTGRREGAVEVACAEASADYVRCFRPAFVSLENVPGYRGSESLRRFIAALEECGYAWSADVLNSADYGTPQTRKRLVLVASRVREPRMPVQTHTERPYATDLFGERYPRWVSWYESTADLHATLPDCELADWQRERLPEAWATMLYAQGGYEGRVVTRDPSQPAFTITANGNQTGIKATLVSSQSVGGGAPALRHQGEPALAVGTGSQRVRAVLVGDQRRQYAAAGRPAFTVRAGENGGASPRAILPGARTVRMSPRCLARWQDLPDNYWLPDSDTLACKGIGNGMPARLMAATAAANI